MLKLRGDRLFWRKSDDVVMARILSETAARRSAPYQDSIVKLAKQYGAVISPKLERRLRQAKKFRRDHKALKLATDAKPRSKRQAKFFKHQRADLAYIRETALPAYLLAHPPGVGKTLIAMWWAARIVNAQRILVVTPNTAKEQWAREIQRWTGDALPITIVEGTGIEQNAKARTPKGWVITHWESLVHAGRGLTSKQWDVVILDEVQHIQNRDAKRTKAAFKLRANHRIALTGHPYTNSEAELFPILKFLYPREYTSFWRFVAMHIEVVPKIFGGLNFIGTKRPNTLKWELEPFVMRRTKKEVFPNLPILSRVTRTVHLTAKGQREYGRLKKEFFAELETIDPDTPRILAIPSILARTTRMRQYLIDPGILGAREPSVKYPAVLELIEELDAPPVIFTMFRQSAERLQLYLAKKKIKRVGLVAGASSKRDKAKRSQVQRNFHAGNLEAVIIVTAAGGTALNYGKYGYVIHLDLPWNPRDLEQTEGRVDRPEEGTGRQVPTTAYPIIVANSYEERMAKKIEGKHKRFKQVFSVSDLRNLFE